MLIRTAFWIGKPKPQYADELRTRLNDQLIPAMRQFPGVLSVRALWPKEREDNPPEIYCQVIIEYTSADGMQQMLTSKARADLRSQVIAAIGLFEGTVSHINYEVS